MDETFSSPGAPPPPPPPVAPPPVIKPPTPSKSSKGRGWMVFAIVLIVLLFFCVVVIFALVGSRAMNFSNNFSPGMADREAGPQLQEAILKDNDSSDKIAVITVDGIISSHQADQSGSDMVEVIKAQLDKAKKDYHVKAVILKVDSPGGEVMASDEIYRAIKKFQSSSGKPVICSMGSLAASGGYYISSPCRWIVANQLTITGSIGVIMETVNYRGLMDKIGVEPYVFKSGKFKDMLSGMRETNEIPAGEHDLVQGLINETYAQFKQVVADGRGTAHKKNGDEGQPLANDWTNYADGRVVSGTEALQLGLVDELGDFQDAVDRANKIAGIENANLVEYQETYDISQLFRLFNQSQQSRAQVKLDMGFDLPKLEAGQLYFLYLPTAD